MIPLLILIVTLIPTPAFALDCSPSSMSSADAIPCFFQTVADIAGKFVYLGLAIGGSICAAVIIYGGLQYISGNKNARTTILAAIVGLLIIIISFAIVNTLSTFTIK